MLRLLLAVYCLVSSVHCLDLTTQPFGHDSVVVEAVIDRIRESCIFPEEHRFLRRWAYMTTRDGTLPDTFANQFQGGIWKISQAMFDATQNTTLSPLLKPYYDRIRNEIGRDWMRVTWVECLKPLYSGLAAVLYTVIQMSNHGITSVPPEVEKQAALWEQYSGYGDSAFNFTSAASILNQGCKNNEAIDLVFIIDSSSSVNPDDFVRTKEFVKLIVDQFSISDTQTRIAVIQYSTDVKEAFGFQANQEANAIKKLIDNVQFTIGSTNTAGALDTARATFRLARPTAVKAVVLITDGKSDDHINTEHAADRLKAEGIVVFAVGVSGLINTDELNYVATSPACTHSYTILDYSGINGLIEEIQHSVCRAPLYANATVTCEIGRCPPYAFPLTSVGLTIQANITCGGVTVYSSVSQAYPSQASSDREVFVQFGNISEFFQQGFTDSAEHFLYVKPDDNLQFGAGHCLLTLTPFQGQLKHTVYVYCEENGVIRNCTQEERCPGGSLSYNPCTKENMATGKKRFPYPGDNTMFITCDARGKAYPTKCPSGEVFSANCESCYGSNVAVTNCKPNQIDTSFNRFCTRENIQAGRFYFTHPTDIHKYIQCDPWGQAYVMTCELDYIWQEQKLTCEKRDTLLNPCEHMHENGNERFYAYPFDCKKFIQCNDDLDPLVFDCPALLIWNDCIKTCMGRTGVSQECLIDPKGPLASYINSPSSKCD